MKNRSFWSILLFAGMIIAAGVGFNSCEKSGGTSGGGGSSSGGGGGTVSDTLEHCWEVTFTYPGDEKTVAHYWRTEKDIKATQQKYLQDSIGFTYKLSTAKSESACDALDIDPKQEMCWKITYTYKGESQASVWYDWTTLERIQEYEQDAAAKGDKMTYEAGYAGDKESCEDRNEGGGGQQGQTYYIKHPWGTGQDADWEWKEFEYDEGVYYVTGEWGGVGANINTTPSDAGATWIPEKDIYGSTNVSVGQYVMFEFNPNSTSLMVAAW